MKSPYLPPEREPESSHRIVMSHFKLIIFMVFCYLFIGALSWLVIPNLLMVVLGIEYRHPPDAALILDLIFSFVVFVGVVAIFSSLSKKNAFWYSISSGFIGFIIFYVELGGVENIGIAGLPFWYDIAHFVTYPLVMIVAGFVGNQFNKR